MPADRRASPNPGFAVLQNCMAAFARLNIRVGLAALFISTSLATAADLPQTFSDPVPGAANPSNQNPVLQTNSKVLPVDAAFALQSFIEADTSIVLRWEMPEGYYLYRKSLAVEKADGTSISLDLPAAEMFTDEFFGEVAIYRNSLLVRLPFTTLGAKPGAAIELLLSYQGCAEALYCYPPEQKALTLNLPE